MEVYPETTSVSKEAKKGSRGGGGWGVNYLPFPSPQSTTAVLLRLFPFTPTKEPGPWRGEDMFSWI